MPAVSAASIGRCRGITPNSPLTPGAVKISTDCVSFTPSGVTISRASVSAIRILEVRRRRSGRGRLHLGRGGLHVVDVALQVERLLRQVVERAREDLLEARDRLLQRDV